MPACCALNSRVTSCVRIGRPSCTRGLFLRTPKRSSAGQFTTDGRDHQKRDPTTCSLRPHYPQPSTAIHTLRLLYARHDEIYSIKQRLQRERLPRGRRHRQRRPAPAPCEDSRSAHPPPLPRPSLTTQHPPLTSSSPSLHPPTHTHTHTHTHHKLSSYARPPIATSCSPNRSQRSLRSVRSIRSDAVVGLGGKHTGFTYDL